ncbi:MAG: radical SAM protein [Bacteroidetes bacterium]|nr:radical SAM protein [Bacteroidota bacterium]
MILNLIDQLKIKHVNIPIFIPELACPHQCIFCNQKKISGAVSSPSPVEVVKTIEEHLATINPNNSNVEIAFFGGNFTGLKKEEQIEYLIIAHKYIQEGVVDSVRLSTRPDYISNDILRLLSQYKVKTIELGAQSMHDEVLQRSGRGHTVEQTIVASKMIKDWGFDLGLQMMIGLPGDTMEKSITTAEQIITLGATNTRIYPTLVIKDTKLEELHSEQKFSPLTLDESVRWTSEVYKIFESGGVKILRVGLHPSEGLLHGGELIAGPFHQSYRELVLTELWHEELKHLAQNNTSERICIFVNPYQLNYAVGYHGKNRDMLLNKFRSVKFIPDAKLIKREFNVSYS